MTDATAEYHWRETYFLFFTAADRPTLAQVEARLSRLNDAYKLIRMSANDDGFFESVTVESPEDNAAVEICYEASEAVMEQTAELAKQLQDEASSEDLIQLLRADARLDVMHFERVADGESHSDDPLDEMLDPGCLLLVVDALVEFTGGIAVDPAAGAILP